MTFAMGPALDRRGFLTVAAGAGLSWLTPVGRLLADQAERSRQPAQSIILLWLGGGPSQLETFDPHPDTTDRRRDQGDSDLGSWHPTCPRVRATGRPDGLGRPGSVDGQQGG